MLFIRSNLALDTRKSCIKNRNQKANVFFFKNKHVIIIHPHINFRIFNACMNIIQLLYDMSFIKNTSPDAKQF
jgi:hypothetical protein